MKSMYGALPNLLNSIFPLEVSAISERLSYSTLFCSSHFLFEFIVTKHMMVHKTMAPTAMTIPKKAGVSVKAVVSSILLPIAETVVKSNATYKFFINYFNL